MGFNTATIINNTSAVANNVDTMIRKPVLSSNVVPQRRVKRTTENRGPTRFTVHYCHNCDGGLQEMTTAATCIRQMFPQTTILGSRKRAFPIRVKVVAHVAPGYDVTVWEGSQKRLFQKYRNKRSATMREICQNLKVLQNDYYC